MKHQPVFKSFILYLLRTEDQVILDATLGEGGHAQSFLEAGKKVIAFERDPHIAKQAEKRLSAYLQAGKLIIHHDNYKQITLKKLGEEVDLALFDLGISKFHYLDGGRGFSFQKEEILDMRLDIGGKDGNGIKSSSASEIINRWREDDLANLFYRYGEETLSRPCARMIVTARAKEPILTTTRLAELIVSVYKKKKVRSHIHPATKIFQALRIEVNRELEHIIPGIGGAIDCLSLGGRVAVIAYHSLEDRRVKEVFRSRITPRKNYNKYLSLKNQNKNYKPGKSFAWLNKKVIRPDHEEIKNNPSARSACLRVLVRTQ